MPKDTSQTPCFNCGRGVDRKSKNRPGKYCSDSCRFAKWKEVREARQPPIDPVNKLCGKCAQTKLREEFSGDANRRDGKYPYCKDCVREYQGSKLRQAAELSKNEYNRVRYHRLKRDLGEAAIADVHRTNHLRSKYGLTIDAYDAMFEAQGGRCAICQTHHSDTNHMGRGGKLQHFAVDHDHSCCPGRVSCGKCVRALLCRSCNTGLGHFKEDPDLMAQAIQYLMTKVVTPLS